MRFRFALATLTACAVAVCAAAGSHDTGSSESDDAGPMGGDDGGGEGGAIGQSAPDAGPIGAPDAADAEPVGATGATGPSVFDSGPPATIGGGIDSGPAEDAGEPDTGPAGPDGGCVTIAQCLYQLATEVSGVGCVNGVCTITCNGENYDVNGLLADGCEVAAICPASQGNNVCPVDHHTQANAAGAGSYPCDDGSSAQNMTGTVPSDNRTHVPAIDGFNTGTGAAADYFSINATGGLTCQDDANLNLPWSRRPCSSPATRSTCSPTRTVARPATPTAPVTAR